MNIKEIKVEDAVGQVLAHDMTKIVPGKFKGVGFKRNHRVSPEDIPELLKIGKKHLYVLELDDSHIHEDDAALRIAAALCGQNLRWTDPKEGRSNLISAINGLLEIDVAGLLEINSIGELIVSTIKTGMPCAVGQMIAATRIIPLFTEIERIERLEEIASSRRPILQVWPYVKSRIGLVVTGSEVYEGLVADESDEWVVSRFKEYGCQLVRKIVVSDDAEQIAAAIKTLAGEGCEVIITTGGLSVDPDDVTRKGVRDAGAEIISYGSPILPGAMFLNARLGDLSIIGLPAAVFYYPRTVYDLMLPRVLAGRQPSAADIAAMGHGGLCMNCEVCHFPECPFGR
jgi:molybdenum cofactor synthesis domain-containing protein